MHAALTEGTIFANRYRLQAQIGSGGFGAVYHAVHVVTERRVALKLLWPHFAQEREFRTRFLREARLAAQIGSEFIVDVLDAGVDEATDMPFLVMELLKGESLATRVSRKRTFSVEDSVIYLSQVAAALDRTHARGVVHRDLKPPNLFLTQRGDGSPLVKVLDFGIAKLLASSGLENASHTMGTPFYMSPEQFAHSAVTPAVDIYALGMIAFRFLVGKHYFQLEQAQCENVYLFGTTIARGPTEPARVRAERYQAELPESFNAWFARVCHVEPSERFASASQAVLAFADAFGVPAAPPLAGRTGERPKGALTHGVESIPERILRTGQRPQHNGGGTLPLEERKESAPFTLLAPTAPPESPDRQPPILNATVTSSSSELTVAGAVSATLAEPFPETEPISLHTLASETVTDPLPAARASVTSASTPAPTAQVLAAPASSRFGTVLIATLVSAMVAGIVVVVVLLVIPRRSAPPDASAASARTESEPNSSAFPTLGAPASPASAAAMVGETTPSTTSSPRSTPASTPSAKRTASDVVKEPEKPEAPTPKAPEPAAADSTPTKKPKIYSRE